jgi:nicotinamidase/pyrazinamidase
MARKRTKRPGRRRADRLLLIVDMLNGFLEPDGSLYCGDHARRIIPFVRRRIERYVEADRPVVFICDSHEPEDPEFDTYGQHCVRGTWEAEIIDELPTADASVLHKKTLSSFYDTQLAAKLRSHRPRVVEVVGVCTDICVLYTVYDLKARDYDVEVPRRGVHSFNRPGHEAALRILRTSLKVSVT